MKRADRRLDRKQILLRTAIGLVLIAAVLLIAYRLAENWEDADEIPVIEQTEQVDENTARLARLTYNDKNYIENSSVSTLLIQIGRAHV